VYIEGEDSWLRPTKLHIILWSIFIALIMAGIIVVFFFVIVIIPFLIINAWIYSLDIPLIFLLVFLIGFLIYTPWFLARMGRAEVLLVKCDKKTYEKISREIGPMLRQLGYEIWSKQRIIKERPRCLR
jgi:hypothetical protein